MVLNKLLLLTLCLLGPSFSFGQALPSNQNPIMDQMLKPASTVIARSRGFAANDPRIHSTVKGMSLKLGAGLLLKRSVPALMLTAISSIYLDDLIQLGNDSPTEMGWTSDGKYKIYDPSFTISTILKPYPSTVDLLISDCGVGQTCYYSTTSITSPIIKIHITEHPYSYNGPSRVASPGDTTGINTLPYWNWFSLKNLSDKRLWIWRYNPSSSETITAPESSPTTEPLTLDDAISKIPESSLNSPITNQLHADTLNELWRQASLDPDYRGLPFDSSRPIKSEDIDPAISPSVRDWTKPLTDSQIEEFSNFDPSDQSIKPASDSTKIDLGDDPAIQAPELEKTPTGLEIFSPILQEGSKLQISVSSRSGECPKPQFNLFNSTQIIDAHCDLMDLYASQIRLIMLSVFSIAAFFIVLRA